MKLAIVGSRTYDNYSMLSIFVTMTSLAHGPVTEIISGGARGADRLGERWAGEHKIPVTQFLPDWETHGKAAGYIRNKDIVAAADFVLAFWDGESRGTKHSIDLAKAQGKPLIVIREDEKGAYTEEYMV